MNDEENSSDQPIPSDDQSSLLSPTPQPTTPPTRPSRLQVGKLLFGSFLLGFFGCGMALAGGNELFFLVGSVTFVIGLLGFFIGILIALFRGIRSAVRAVTRRD